MAHAEHVARYFLWLAANEPEEEPVTHMRLQKLLYYAQGWSLASRAEPLFAGQIQAWRHGPVAPDVYATFKRYGGDPIARDQAAEPPELAETDRRLIRWVWRNYGKYSAGELWRMTHSEPPWLSAREGLEPDAAAKAPVSDKVMRDYFTKQHDERCARAGLDPQNWHAAMEDIRAGRTAPLDQVLAELRRGVAH